MKSNLTRVSAVLAILTLTGCIQGPDYSRPKVPAQAGWKTPQDPPAPTPVLPQAWWTVFHDADLDALETRAVASNQDLQRAVARVTEARALARVAGSERFPTVTGNGSYAHQRLSEGTENALPTPEFNELIHTVDLQYELDVWGRVRRNTEAANRDAAAVATDLQVVLLTLTADVAASYHWIRSLDSEKSVVEATTALRQDALRLQEARYRAGLINEIDVTRARTELANVEAERHAIVRSRAQWEHALAVLCGEPPAQFAVAPRTSVVVPPAVPAGLPSSLLERRPDIVGAEQRLQAASARIGTAKAAFFPVIKLTGTAGLASADLGSLLDWPSRVASFGPAVSVPIFNGRRNRSNLEASEARYEQSVAQYRGTILNAFREVEDSLSDLGTLTLQAEAVHRALAAARDTASLASERYQQGISSYLEVVDAQRVALQAERLDAQLRGHRAVSTVQLAKALGGGWEGPTGPGRSTRSAVPEVSRNPSTPDSHGQTP